ncbi:MAG: S1C family serine protease [Clostridiales Family XIII bacterium]|jgi:S1-C subfamily serine protease|nr:S1C family serine protease [Clostridiales Family XIII bacterium]
MDHEEYKDANRKIGSYGADGYGGGKPDGADELSGASTGFILVDRVPGGIGRSNPSGTTASDSGGSAPYGAASAPSGAGAFGGSAPYGAASAPSGAGAFGGSAPYGAASAPSGAAAPSASARADRRKRRKSSMIALQRRTVAFFAVFVAVACLLSGIGGGFIALRLAPGISESGSGNSYTINTTSDIGTTEAVAKKVLDSVVGITSTYTQENSFFGRTQESSGVGTGIIIHKEGYILTNSHVVMDGSSDKIKVLLSDGTEVDAKILWNDETIDLAVLKAEAKGLVPVELGDSDRIRIGAYVAAIGNPLGLDFSGSITQGVVSGLNRSITASSSTKTTRMEGLIQVDAAINSGNSGGPLLNSKGEVIGVNTAKASAEGMGFAIPINTAKPIINKIIETGSFERVYMGVSAANASDIASQYPNLNLSVKEGAFISEVTAGSPAAEAGLRMKDVITSVDGKAITGSTDLIKTLLNYSAGDVVEVVFVRDGREETLRVTLASQAQVYGETGTDGFGSQGNGGVREPQGGDPFENPIPGGEE